MGMAITRDNTPSIKRFEIEEKLKNMGDYAKMGYLSQCLKKNLDFDTRRFVLLKLSEIYEARKMHMEAGKMMRAAAEITTTYEGKMNDFMKSAELFIKAGNFEESDSSYNKALAYAAGMQKDRLKNRRKEAYKLQGKEFLQKDKRKHAMDAYEKLLTMELTAEEKKEVQETLLMLYEKLGKIKEFYALKASMN
ncbi:MAG: hypothetical protein N3D20_01655 [Candidatus Pacearchaeota archaeon]|nr:hypothetical protein [Candidatus Pacearchaeota archaeon]